MERRCAQKNGCVLVVHEGNKKKNARPTCFCGSRVRFASGACIKIRAKNITRQARSKELLRLFVRTFKGTLFLLCLLHLYVRTTHACLQHTSGNGISMIDYI